MNDDEFRRLQLAIEYTLEDLASLQEAYRRETGTTYHPSPKLSETRAKALRQMERDDAKKTVYHKHPDGTHMDMNADGSQGV